MTPEWLSKAVFYEIYPSSFMDSNGDGIGDLRGIIAKLPYVKELGCNALWLNPFYESAFKDGGYDVVDYKAVDPRYGTLEDAAELFKAAHDLGIRVLIDLVPGHTSERHPWFVESSKPERNEYSDRYVWSDSAFQGINGHMYVSGEAERDGVYMINYFKSQPALNYGFGKPAQPFEMRPDAPACMATREALYDICRFWLDLGCDGFRADMADSLVKDDIDKSYTAEVWRGLREILDRDYPDAAIVSEWSNARQAVGMAGFHMDFCLDHEDNATNVLFRRRMISQADSENEKDDAPSNGALALDDAASAENEKPRYVPSKEGSIAAGKGDFYDFLRDYLPRYAYSKDKGYIGFISGNHDVPRLSAYLTEPERRAAFAFMLTMPGVPFIYYGDEIGMTYRSGLPTKEGGYRRTGSRTPMQWDASDNAGFSKAAPEKLYLPVSGAAAGENVKAQSEDPASLRSEVKELIALRLTTPDLQADAPFKLAYAQHEAGIFAAKRGNTFIFFNFAKEERTLSFEEMQEFSRRAEERSEDTSFIAHREWCGPLLPPEMYDEEENEIKQYLADYPELMLSSAEAEGLSAKSFKKLFEIGGASAGGRGFTLAGEGFAAFAAE